MTDPFISRWGAHLDADGSAIFRLWAPSVEQMRLELMGRGILDLERDEDGWHEVRIADAQEGQEYCFVLPDGARVPDPASRSQASDVHGPSVLTGSSFEWRVKDWKGKPWEEAVVYVLHPGTFTPEGSFAAIMCTLEHPK